MMQKTELNTFLDTLIFTEENLRHELQSNLFHPKDMESSILITLHRRIQLYQFENNLRRIKNKKSPFEFYLTHLRGYLLCEMNPSRNLVRYEIEELTQGTDFFVDDIETEFLRSFTMINFEMLNMELREDTDIKINIYKFTSEHIMKHLHKCHVSLNSKLIFLLCSLMIVYLKTPADEISMIINDEHEIDLFYDFFDSTIADVVVDGNSDVLNLMYYLKAISLIFV